MAIPTTRTEFRDFCLRKLGHPVIEINISEDQMDDRIDQSLRYYADYHYDGSEKIYYKHLITGGDFPGAAKEVTVTSGGTLYSNSDTITITNGTGANGTITTYANGTIQAITITENGSGYSNSSVLSINTSTGSGANVALVTGDGSITLPENIMGAVKIFPMSDPSTSSDILFDIRYQIAMSDLYTLNNVSLVPYYMAREHLSLISEILVGQQPIRYSRHRDKLYIDMTWNASVRGRYLLVEAYQVIDPEEFTDVWSDRWLQNYVTEQFKYQWGSNLTKFTGVNLPGGVQFNGDRILTDAQQAIEKMEQEMISAYSLPVLDFYG